MKLAACGAPFAKEKPLEEILQVLTKYGVDAIEIWPWNVPLEGDHLPYQEDRYEGRQIEEVRKITKLYNIQVACVTMPGAFNKEMVSEPEVYASSLRYAVDVAKELQAPLVNHYCIHLAPERQANISNYLSAVAPAVERAEQQGVTIVLENEAHDASATPEGMLRIVQSVASERFRTVFDACNYYQASQEGFPFAYELLKDYIVYVHIKNGCVFQPQAGHSEENRGEGFTGSNAPNHIYYPILSKGAVNIDGLLLRLAQDGYDGYCTVEPHTTPNNVEDYYRQETDYLRKRGFFI